MKEQIENFRIAGLDYSLGCPAICFNGPDDDLFVDTFCYFKTSVKKYAKTFHIKKFKFIGSMHEQYYSEEQRYDNLAWWVINIQSEAQIKIIYLEDYSYSSTGRVFHIAENTGVLKHQIWASCWPYERLSGSSDEKQAEKDQHKHRNYDTKIRLVAPAAVKKFATGKGNASKWDMHDQFEKDTGINLSKEITPNKAIATNPVNDIVDAYYILKYGEHDALDRKQLR